MISIVGSGLTGLSCAIHLLNSSIPVEIYEARQEIGNPIRSPGLLTNFDSKYIECHDASNRIVFRSILPIVSNVNTLNVM